MDHTTTNKLPNNYCTAPWCMDMGLEGRHAVSLRYKCVDCGGALTLVGYLLHMRKPVHQTPGNAAHLYAI